LTNETLPAGFSERLFDRMFMSPRPQGNAAAHTTSVTGCGRPKPSDNPQHRRRIRKLRAAAIPLQQTTALSDGFPGAMPRQTPVQALRKM